jgi:hypothetical protein
LKAGLFGCNARQISKHGFLLAQTGNTLVVVAAPASWFHGVGQLVAIAPLGGAVPNEQLLGQYIASAAKIGVGDATFSPFFTFAGSVFQTSVPCFDGMLFGGAQAQVPRRFSWYEVDDRCWNIASTRDTFMIVVA